jgi:hypothetical protein
VIRGIRGAGIDVIDLGLVTTPMAYFAAYQLGTRCAVMVTGSHNPPDYNGLKIVLADEALSGEAIQALRRRIEAGALGCGQGCYRCHDIAEAYVARIVGDVRLTRPMKILVDAGNGVAGAYAPALFRALGCQVEEMFCQVDGTFPNHHPDPSVPENLAGLIARLRETDSEIGLAFDGDGDRLGVVAKDGRIIYPDRQLMLFADDVLSRNPGAQVIFDVKSTRNLYKWISDRGGHPMLWKTGHSVMKAKMRETGALLAGEMSGHVFFLERWYGFDDGLYAGARLLEYLSAQEGHRCHPARSAGFPLHPRAAHQHEGRRTRPTDGENPGRRPFRGRARRHRPGWIEGGVCGWIRPDAGLEHHAGHRVEVRGGRCDGVEADSGHFPRGIVPGLAGSLAAVLKLSGRLAWPSGPALPQRRPLQLSGAESVVGHRSGHVGAAVLDIGD